MAGSHRTASGQATHEAGSRRATHGAEAGRGRRFGTHVSEGSRRMLALRRARRVAAGVVAAIALVALVLAGVNMASDGVLARRVVGAWASVGGAGVGAGVGAGNATAETDAADQTSHAVLKRGTVPAVDPGDIVIGVNGSETTIVLRGETYVEGGAHAIEPSDGVLTDRIEISGAPDTSTPGDYPVRYTVRDSHGHVASATRTVRVVDSMDTQQGGLPVLMYHYVYDPANPPDTLNSNYIAAPALEEQLRYLTEHGFYHPSWPEVRAFVEGTHSLPARSVVLTFDDGEPGFFSVGGPLLAKYRVPATSFVIANDGGAPQRMKDYASPYLEYESHSYDMHRAGGTVGHGGRISAMTRQEIVDDLNRSKSVTGSLQAFAYPFGDVTADAQGAMDDAGVLVAFTTQYGWAEVGGDPTKLPRVRVQGDGSLDQFVASIQ